MKSSRFLAILMTLTILCAAAFAPQAALADANSRFTGSWYANSFVLKGLEYFPETWDEDLVMTLGADGYFTWSGKFYNDFFGTWNAPSDTEIRLIPDEEDGTPGAEEDPVILNLNQDGYLVYIEENGPTILFADHMPEKEVWPEIIRAENADAFSGAWVLERIMVADMFVSPAQFAVTGGVEVTSTLVLDDLDAYLMYSTDTGALIDWQMRMRYEDGSLVQERDSAGIYLRRVSLTDTGMLAVELCPDASGEEPLYFYYGKAE